MKVQMDKKKIEKSGEYSLEQLNNMVVEVARDRGITKRNDRGLFIGNGDDEDFSNFGLIVLYLAKQEWFMHFVKTWMLYAEEETDDLAEYFRNYNKQKMENA